MVFLDVEQRVADRIMLADDRLAALSELDDRRVADLMKEISEGEWLATGYSVEEANKLFEQTGVDDIEVFEIETSNVTDHFWLAVRGPLAEQALVLQRMKTLLAGVSIGDGRDRHRGRHMIQLRNHWRKPWREHRSLRHRTAPRSRSRSRPSSGSMLG